MQMCILQAETGERFDTCWSQCQVCRDYQAGKTKPRYPVPALRTEVQTFPDRVLLFVKHACHWCMYEWLRA